VSPFTIAALRAVHVLATSFWFGVMLMNAAFLLPAVRAAGPAGGAVTRYLVQSRRLPAFINLAVVLALLSGAALFWWVSGGLNTAWLATPHGLACSAGSLLSILAALLGQFVNAPTAARLGRLGAEIQSAGGPPAPAAMAEVQQLQSRLASATTLAAALLALAAVAMAVARYV
jgi:uncharacterized membrane protein